MQGWVGLVGSLVAVAIVLTAFGLKLGILKPTDAVKRVAGILGIVMLCMALPAAFMSIWSGMSVWQRLGLRRSALAAATRANAEKDRWVSCRPFAACGCNTNRVTPIHRC